MNKRRADTNHCFIVARQPSRPRLIERDLGLVGFIPQQMIPLFHRGDHGNVSAPEFERYAGGNPRQTARRGASVDRLSAATDPAVRSFRPVRRSRGCVKIGPSYRTGFGKLTGDGLTGLQNSRILTTVWCGRLFADLRLRRQPNRSHHRDSLLASMFCTFSCAKFWTMNRKEM